MKTYFKGLLSGYRSSYDPSFSYRTDGWTVHPNPDRGSRAECGAGLHLCKGILTILSYVKEPTLICRAVYREKLGEGSDKIRVAKVKLVSVCPWTKLKPLYDDYQAKLKTLDGDFQAKRKPLDGDFQAKRKTLYGDYQAKRKTLYGNYQAKRKPLDGDYQAKRKTLYDDCQAKLKTLYDDYQAKLKTLYDDYQAKLEQKFREEAVPI